MNRLALTALVACLTSPALAQTTHDAAAEIAALERALTRVDEALADLEPLHDPPYTVVHYDVRQLLYTPYDHPAPSLEVPSDTGNGGGSFVFYDEEPVYYALDPDQLEEILCYAIGEDEWDDPASIQIVNGWLLVRQTARHHGRLRATLNALRRDVERSLLVEVGVYRLPSELAAELRAQSDANDGVLTPEVLAQLDAAARESVAELTDCALLRSRTGQWISLSRLRQHAYLGDVERSSGGTGEVVEEVSDPIVETLSTGMSLQVRGNLCGETIQLELRHVTSTLKGFQKQTSDFGAVEIDSPSVERRVVSASGRVPSGSGVILSSDQGDDSGPVWIVARPRLISR
jgi:hypothetical protein